METTNQNWEVACLGAWSTLSLWAFRIWDPRFVKFQALFGVQLLLIWQSWDCDAHSAIIFSISTADLPSHRMLYTYLLQAGIGQQAMFDYHRTTPNQQPSAAPVYYFVRRLWTMYSLYMAYYAYFSNHENWTRIFPYLVWIFLVEWCFSMFFYPFWVARNASGSPFFEPGCTGHRGSWLHGWPRGLFAALAAPGRERVVLARGWLLYGEGQEGADGSGA